MKSINEEAKAFMIWRAATVARIGKKKRGRRKRLTKPLGHGRAFAERPSVDRIMPNLIWVTFE